MLRPLFEVYVLWLLPLELGSASSVHACSCLAWYLQVWVIHGTAVRRVAPVLLALAPLLSLSHRCINTGAPFMLSCYEHYCSLCAYC